MFANVLNEVLLVLVQSFRVGIKGCEHESVPDRDERTIGYSPSVTHHHVMIHGKMVGYASPTCHTLVIAREDVLSNFAIFG